MADGIMINLIHCDSAKKREKSYKKIRLLSTHRVCPQILIKGYRYMVFVAVFHRFLTDCFSLHTFIKEFDTWPGSVNRGFVIQCFSENLELFK